MASVLAIVDAAIAGELGPGDVWPIDEYESDDALDVLDALEGGGDLLLAAARSSGEVWLMAVLRDPRASSRGWRTVSPNAEPIRDITRSVRERGIAASPGRPCVLSDTDAIVVRVQPGIAAARMHASHRAWADALARLLEAWRASPRRAVADAIAALDRVVKTPVIARHEWIGVARYRESHALRGLLATIFDTVPTDVRDRIAALSEWPLDPRIDRWVAELCAAPRRDSLQLRPWLQPLVERIVDRAAIEVIGGVAPPELRLTGVEQRDLESITAMAGVAMIRSDAHRQADALLAEVLAHPDDDGPRGVLADVLAAIGDPRGELIALQLAPPTPERELRARHIASDFRSHLLGALAPVVRDAVFERGFLARATLAADLAPRDERALRDCLDDPLWATVEHLETPYDARRGNASTVARRPPMRSLRSLRWPDVPISTLTELTRLEALACKQVTREDVDAILGGFPALRTLVVELASGISVAAPLAERLLSAPSAIAKLVRIEIAVELERFFFAADRAHRQLGQLEQLARVLEAAARSPIREITIRAMRDRAQNWSSYYTLSKSDAGLEVALGVTDPRSARLAQQHASWEPQIEPDLLGAIAALERLHPRRLALETPPRTPAIRERIERRLSSLRTP